MAASGKAIEDFNINEVMSWDYISNELRNWSKEKGLTNQRKNDILLYVFLL